MEDSEQGSGFLVQLVACVVIAMNVPAVQLPEPEPVVACQFAGKPAGRDTDGMQTFEYGVRCFYE